MNDIMSLGTLQSVKSIFQKKPEHNVIIDPFSCLIKLSLLRFLDAGTKISIQNMVKEMVSEELKNIVNDK